MIPPDPRPARPGDLPAVLQLLAAAALPVEGVAEHFDHFLVAVDERGPAGVAGLEHHGPAALLRSLAVRSDWRGLGLGVLLTRRILEQARLAGSRQVFLLTETAPEFFPRFGFRVAAREEAGAALNESVEFRSACPQSAVCMRLDLAV